MKSRAAIAFSLLVLSSQLVRSDRAHAQAVELITLAGSGLVASKLIEQFEQTANRLMQNAANKGDALASKFGNELNVATRNIASAIGNERAKIYKDLSPTTQRALDALNEIIETANKSIDKAATIAEVGNINLIELSSRLPFMTSKVDSWISSLEGLTQIDHDGDYEFTIRGVGFGFPANDKPSKVNFVLQSKEAPAVNIQHINGSQTKITLSNDMMKPYFKDGEMGVADAVINNEITRPKGCWFVPTWLFACGTETALYSTPVRITFLPRNAAKISGFEVIGEPALGDDILRTSVSNTTQDCETDKPCDWIQEVSLSSDEEVVDVTFEKSGKGCPFSYGIRAGIGQNIDYEILNNKTKVVVYRHNDGEDVCTVTHYVHYKKRITKNVVVAIEEQSVSFDKPFVFMLNPKNPNCNYVIDANLFTKQKSTIDNGMSISPDGLIKRLASTTVGDQCRITLKLSPP